MFFGIANDILIVGYDTDGKDHDRTLCWIIWIFLLRKLMPFRCTKAVVKWILSTSAYTQYPDRHMKDSSCP